MLRGVGYFIWLLIFLKRNIYLEKLSKLENCLFYIYKYFGIRWYFYEMLRLLFMVK